MSLYNFGINHQRHVSAIKTHIGNVYITVPWMLWTISRLKSSGRIIRCIFLYGATASPPPPRWARTSSFTKLLDHTQRRTTVGRTPLDEWWTQPRDLYLTTHNTHSRQTSMPTVGFEPTIPAGERPQTYALDRAATETGIRCTTD